ncbi:MAG: site-specific integrase [Chloroflexota bacterium]
MTQNLIPAPANSLASIQELQELALDYASKSKSDNTKNAYASDWADFESWATLHNVPTRPARPETVALYITHLAKSGSKTSTIQRRLVAISQAHKGSGYESPTAAQIVRATMSGIRRTIGTATEGKAPILTEHVKTWVSGLGDDLVSMRDKALVLVGFAGAFRRSELVGLNYSDLEFTPQGVIVTLRKSKTDQEGKGRRVGIPYGKITNGTPSPTCPVTALLAWLETAHIESGPVFRRLRRGGIVTPDRLESKSVSLIVKGLCQTVGLEPDLYGAHSLRAGHITQAAKNGAGERETMRQSGHKSLEVFRGYVRDAEIFQQNSAVALDL